MAIVIVAAAIIRREGKVLLTKRLPGAHLAGYWEFPGGKLEEGESPEAALVRECREECGIEVRPVDIFQVTFYRYPKKDVLLLFYDCVLEAGDVQNIQVAEHVWCAPSEIASYVLPPADVEVVAKLARSASS